METIKGILVEANSYLKAGCKEVKTIDDIMEMDISFDQWSSLESRIDKL